MLGVELVKDRKTKTPAKEETLHLFEELKGNAALYEWPAIFRAHTYKKNTLLHC